MNHGKEIHHLVPYKLSEGQTVADLVKAIPQGPIPSTAVMLGGPNPTLPGGAAEATVNLAPGKYAMFCVVPGADGQPHVMKGMIRALTVTPSTETVAEPNSDVTIKLADYSFDTTLALTAGHHVIRVEDAGPQPPELVLVKTPGEYGMLCFLPDSKDMKPHIMHGMMKQVTVM